MYPGKRRSRRRGNPANKFWLAGLVVASIALMILSRSDAVISRFIINNASDLTAPILEGLSEPIGQMRAAVSSAGSYAYLVDEVGRLRQENDRLRALQGKIEELGDKVRRYEELLNTTANAPSNFVTARVIGDAGSPFVRTVLINGGREDGIGKDQPVVDSRGLVGRTISSGRKAARVLLLTDLNSRIPVRVEPHGYRAVLAGDNTSRPTLDFLPIGARLEAGDRIVTSGHGGLFPPGLPVGIVEASPGGKLVVTLSSPVEYLEYVRVLEPSPPVLPEEPDAGTPDTPVAEAGPDDAGRNAGATAAAPDGVTGSVAGGDADASAQPARRRARQTVEAATAPQTAEPVQEPAAEEPGTRKAFLPGSASDRGFRR